MRGYLYGEGPPDVTCPYCSSPCEAEHCDIGVGMQQIEPHHCFDCGATEIGTYDGDERVLTEEERRTGWYAPKEER